MLTKMYIKICSIIIFLSMAMNSHGLFNQAIDTTTQFESLHSTHDPTIVDANVDIFGANVFHVSQQSGNVLLPFAQMVGMVSARKRIDRMGEANDPLIYGSRGSRVTIQNPPNDVRWINAQRYYLAAFIDNYDQIRTLFDIKSEYAVAMSKSFGRLYDRICISALLGQVCTGANGDGRVALPNTQRFAAMTGVGAAAVSSGLKFDHLRQMRLLLYSRFAVQPKMGEMLVWAITSNEVNSLLDETKLTNRDYTNIMVLMDGQVSSFLGFMFVETELLPKTTASGIASQTAGGTFGQLGSASGTTIAAGSVRTICFVASKALCFGINKNLEVFADRLSLYHRNWMLYYASEFGAMRKEEVSVVEFVTKDERPTA